MTTPADIPPRDAPRDLPAEKAALRALMRERRRAIPLEQRASDAGRLADVLLGIPGLVSAQLVLAYGANADELDPEPALARLRALSVRVAYPRVVGDALHLHEVGDPHELVQGAFGIREPAPDADRVRSVDVDAVLVPAIAFDRRGFRLGYGGGYYDRLLPELRPDALRVGIAFDEQVVDEVPIESYDERVWLVATPSGILRT